MAEQPAVNRQVLGSSPSQGASMNLQLALRASSPNSQISQLASDL